MSLSTTNDPYRFDEGTQGAGEARYRMELGEHFDSSPLSSVEKLYNFSRYVPRAILTRFLSRTKCFEKVLDVQGVVIDCGVLFGSSLMTWAKLSSIYEPLNSQRKIIGFDTFDGFPGLSDQDSTGSSEESKDNGFGHGDPRVLEDLLASVQLYDEDRQLGHLEKVSVVKGDISETIPKYLEENPHTVVSLLHLDVDIYDPTRVALESFLPRMPRGAMIVFDELNSSSWPGESIAVLESVGLSNLRIRRFPWDTYLSYAIIGE